MRIDSEIYRVTSTSPAHDRERTYQLGLQFRRERGFDFEPFTPNLGDQEVFIAHEDGYGIGVLIADPATKVGEWDGVSRDELDMRPAPEGVSTFGGVWVARNHRRRGIAKRLVIAACAELEMDSPRWSPPFYADGMALVKSFAKGGPILCGK